MIISLFYDRQRELCSRRAVLIRKRKKRMHVINHRKNKEIKDKYFNPDRQTDLPSQLYTEKVNNRVASLLKNINSERGYYTHSYMNEIFFNGMYYV